MFADLLRLINRRPPLDYERGFVRGVQVSGRSPRNRRTERVLVIGWSVIVVKTVAVFWAFARYHIPVNPLWVVVPTIVFATLCTAVYLLRN
jgi:hypothetical protein